MTYRLEKDYCLPTCPRQHLEKCPGLRMPCYVCIEQKKQGPHDHCDDDRCRVKPGKKRPCDLETDDESTPPTQDCFGDEMTQGAPPAKRRRFNW